jgi:hypothetical protein
MARQFDRLVLQCALVLAQRGLGSPPFADFSFQRARHCVHQQQPGKRSYQAGAHYHDGNQFGRAQPGHARTQHPQQGRHDTVEQDQRGVDRWGAGVEQETGV